MLEERLSKRCLYALRAIFELALRSPSGPFTAQDIALAQKIPARFLQLILIELKHADIVESVRGNEGGYILARKAKDITIGQVIRAIESPHNQTRSNLWSVRGLAGDFAFSKTWNQAEKAVSSLLDQITFADLVEQDKELRQNYVSDYAI